MVIGIAETPANALPQYHLVTQPLYIRGFLGLNMKDADKTLTDSVLSVFRFADSNKTAPKVYENAPICGRGKVKINY